MSEFAKCWIRFNDGVESPVTLTHDDRKVAMAMGVHLAKFAIGKSEHEGTATTIFLVAPSAEAREAFDANPCGIEVV